jgi:hypothetical protein
MVECSAHDCLVLTERDRHLNVMICLPVTGRALTVTSSVVTAGLLPVVAGNNRQPITGGNYSIAASSFRFRRKASRAVFPT